MDAEATVYADATPGSAPVSVWCPTLTQALDAATTALREQAIRLLPVVPVGTTVGSTGSYTLLNTQTIFWAPTTVVRDLGTVTVTGITVRLRATFASAHWDFGDGTTDTTTTPGTVYVPHSCVTRLCPGYYGHTYTTLPTTSTSTSSGPHTATVTLTITWTITDNPTGADTDWHTLTTLTGTPTTTTIPIYTTQAILTH